MDIKAIRNAILATPKEKLDTLDAIARGTGDLNAHLKTLGIEPDPDLDPGLHNLSIQACANTQADYHRYLDLIQEENELATNWSLAEDEDKIFELLKGEDRLALRRAALTRHIKTMREVALERSKKQLLAFLSEHIKGLELTDALTKILKCDRAENLEPLIDGLKIPGYLRHPHAAILAKDPEFFLKQLKLIIQEETPTIKRRVSGLYGIQRKESKPELLALAIRGAIAPKDFDSIIRHALTSEEQKLLEAHTEEQEKSCNLQELSRPLPGNKGTFTRKVVDKQKVQYSLNGGNLPLQERMSLMAKLLYNAVMVDAGIPLDVAVDELEPSVQQRRIAALAEPLDITKLGLPIADQKEQATATSLMMDGLKAAGFTKYSVLGKEPNAVTQLELRRPAVACNWLRH